MPTLTPEQAIEQLSNLPEDKQRLVLGKIDPSVRKGILDKLNVQNLSVNDSGQGTYHMKDKSGASLFVPYGHVNAASKAGYVMTDTDRDRYVDDAKADKSLKPDLQLTKGVTVVGRNSAGEPIFAPADPNAGKAGPISRFLSSTGAAITGAAKGFNSLFDPTPTADEAARGETRPIDDFLRIPQRAIIDPMKAQSDEAYQNLKDGKYVEGAGHELAAAVPFVGPWVAQVAEQTGQQAGSGDVAGAAGTVAGNAIVYAAPHVGGKILSGVAKLPEVPRGLAERLTKTTPREISYMAEDTEKENKKATDVADKKNQDAIDQTAADNIKEQENVNKRNLKQLEDEGKKRLAVIDKNRDQTKNYNETRAKIKQENEELYRNEQTRQKLEKDHQAASRSVIDKTKKAYKTTTAKYNVKWNKWREDVKGIQADMQPAVNEINKQAKTMNAEQQAQFRQILNETRPDEEDTPESAREDAVQDLIAQQKAFLADKDRGQVTASILASFIPNDATYDTLTDAQKAVIDKHIEENGTGVKDLEGEGDGEDEDSESGSGTEGKLKTMDAERLHTLKHQLERAVRTEKDGMIRHAVGKVLDKVRETEETVSKQADAAKYGDGPIPKGEGAAAELADARSYSRPYYDAFINFKDDMPREAGKMLTDQVRDEVKEQAQQARLGRIAAYDPSIATQAKLVNSYDEALSRPEFKKKFFNVKKDLKPLPSQPTPTSEMRGGATPKPLEQFTPDQPKVTPADTKTISPEDFKQRQLENTKIAARHLRDMGLKRSLYASLTGLPFSMVEFFKGAPLGTTAGTAVGGLLAGGAVLMGSDALANLVEKPAVRTWLAKVTPGDAAVFDKLPPEQKALFTQDMKNLLDAARKKNVLVSPALTKFVSESTTATTAASASRKPTLKELKEEALRRNPKAIRVKAPDGSSHVFADQQSADNFKKEVGIR